MAIYGDYGILVDAVGGGGGATGTAIFNTMQSFISQGTSEDTALVAGYSTPNDGGGMILLRSVSEPVHEAKVQASDSSWWEFPTTSPSARQFGALGNGVANDTAALQNFFAYAKRQQAAVGKVVARIPRGSYRVDAQICQLTDAHNGLTIVGEGTDATIFSLMGNLAAPLFEIVGTDNATRAEWISLKHFRCQNNNRTYTGTALKFQHAYHCDVSQVAMDQMDGHAILMDDFWDSDFVQCTFTGCGSPNPTDATAAGVTGQDLATVHILHSNPGAGSQTSNNIIFRSCQFESSWNAQMYLEDDIRSVSVIDCKFHGNQGATISEPHIKIGGAIGGRIIGSYFKYNQGPASDHILFLPDASRTLRARSWAIMGNEFSSAGSAGIRLQDGSHMSIVGNQFGVISANTHSIVVESTVPVGGGDRELQISGNTYRTSAGEKEPEIQVPAAVNTVTTGRSDVVTTDINDVTLRTFMRPTTPAFGNYVDWDVMANTPTVSDVIIGKMRYTLRSVTTGAEDSQMRLFASIGGTITAFVVLDGSNEYVDFEQNTHWGGEWNTTHLILGTHHIWVDPATSTLYIKNGVPTSATDGTVIGSQT